MGYITQYKKTQFVYSKADSFRMKASKNFALNIAAGYYQNLLFYQIGKNEGCNILKMPKEFTIVTDLHYFRAMNIYVFSLYEYLLAEILIEAINNKDIVSVDDLKEYMKDRYSIKGKISFQRLKDVREYYKKVIDIDLGKCSSFDEVEFLIEPRHINTHNFGIPDEKFKRTLWGCFPGIDDAKGIKINEETVDNLIAHMFKTIEYIEAQI